MMSVEATCLALLRYPWRATVHSSLLNAPLNPGSPVFPATAWHLQEALTILAGMDPVTLAAALAFLGVVATRGERSAR